jgi:hypothetical protein
MQVKTYDVVYDDRIRCRMSDLRYRVNIRHRMIAMSYVLRHRMLRCRTCLTYDIDIRCRTSCTYDIVVVRCRTCMTYDIVCNIGIIRCRTSDVRHRMSARIQMTVLGHLRLLLVRRGVAFVSTHPLRLDVSHFLHLPVLTLVRPLSNKQMTCKLIFCADASFSMILILWIGIWVASFRASRVIVLCHFHPLTSHSDFTIPVPRLAICVEITSNSHCSCTPKLSRAD